MEHLCASPPNVIVCLHCLYLCLFLSLPLSNFDFSPSRNISAPLIPTSLCVSTATSSSNTERASNATWNATRKTRAFNARFAPRLSRRLVTVSLSVFLCLCLSLSFPLCIIPRFECEIRSQTFTQETVFLSSFVSFCLFLCLFISVSFYLSLSLSISLFVAFCLFKSCLFLVSFILTLIRSLFWSLYLSISTFLSFSPHRAPICGNTRNHITGKNKAATGASNAIAASSAAAT